LEQFETGVDNIPLHLFIAGVAQGLAGREFQ
jgi:hypothetical protein